MRELADTSIQVDLSCLWIVDRFNGLNEIHHTTPFIHRLVGRLPLAMAA
jgi:hypothetical protein